MLQQWIRWWPSILLADGRRCRGQLKGIVLLLLLLLMLLLIVQLIWIIVLHSRLVAAELVVVQLIQLTHWLVIEHAIVCRIAIV